MSLYFTIDGRHPKRRLSLVLRRKPRFRKPARTQRGHCQSIVNMHCIENLAGALFRNRPDLNCDVLASILLACNKDLLH